MTTDATRTYSPLVIKLATVDTQIAEWADEWTRKGATDNEILAALRIVVTKAETERAVIGNAGDYVVSCHRAITPEEIGWLLCGEFEGNPMASWIGSAFITPGTAGPAGNWYVDQKFIASDIFQFTIQYDDPENDGEGDCTGEKIITRADIIKGLELMAAKSPDHWADLISESSADAVTYDVAMQYIVLGEVVYG